MSEIDHLPVLPDKLGKVLTRYFFAIVCQNPKSDMPAPCCTQTQDPNQPPAGRPIPASSESEMRTCIRLCFSDALRGVLRRKKSPLVGYRSTPTGLKRLKTQNTASYDCNAKWERPYLALPNLYTSANSFRKKNSSTLPTLVEMAGVEPASESQLPRLSTSVSGLLKFPPCSAERQALHFGSLLCMAGVKA